MASWAGLAAGAGFGGCTVSMIEESEAGEFIESVTERYYGDCFRANGYKVFPEECVFRLKAVGGAKQA